MRRINKKPIDKKVFQCPQCHKNRLIRPLDHVVSDEKRPYKTKTGDAVEFFIDICDPCKRRNFRKHFEPSREDIRKVLKTLKEDKELSDDQSLEDLL